MTYGRIANAMTLDEADRLERHLMDLVKNNAPMINISATLVVGAAELLDIPEPTGFVTGSIGSLSETDLATLLVQIECLVLVTLSSIATTATMGEAAFRAYYLKVRDVMLAESGIEVCEGCAADFPRNRDGSEA